MYLVLEAFPTAQCLQTGTGIWKEVMMMPQFQFQQEVQVSDTVFVGEW